METRHSCCSLRLHPSEVSAVRAENNIRKAQGLEERTHHSGVRVYPKNIEIHKEYKQTVYLVSNDKPIKEPTFRNNGIVLNKIKINHNCLAPYFYFNKPIIGYGYYKLQMQKDAVQYIYQLS